MLQGKIWARALLAGAIAMMATSWNAYAQTGPLVRAANITYVGSFKLPAQSGNGFTYGGTAIAYNPANDSLYVVGHQYDQETAEVKIPAMNGTATLLQPLTDSLGGRLNSVGSSTVRIGGNMVYNGKLYVTAFVYYDANGAQNASHFSRSTNLSSGGATGPLRVGSLGAGFYSGYMGAIPAEWQSRLGGKAITGNCCLSIISRTSYGPAAFAFDPEATGQSAQPLVYYDTNHQTLGQYGASGQHPVFNGTTRVTGVVFPQGTSSVLFIGMTGTGNYCYGDGSPCGDPANASKGDHAYPYTTYIWAYDANDLAAVHAGTKQPYSVTPYATWALSEPGNVIMDFGVGGATYDPASGRIYISKRHGDGEQPRIYVYEVNNSIVAKTPNAPTGVSAQ